MTTDSAIFSFLPAAPSRFIVSSDRERIVHQRNVGQVECPILQRLEVAHLRVHGSQQPVLAARQRL
ncbi:hypothetical protein KDW20_33565 [Burkholderia cenocepacia]|nr:hypothetical protein [Burkholderia cenocepacia]MBR8380710.1 hypothetical protein [Burkholderia cenocepacia]